MKIISIELSDATWGRLKRIKKLKKIYSDSAAIEYAVSVGWLVAEKRKALSTKPDPQDSSNKAPITGSNTSNDDKATATDKSVDPNRPKSG